MAAAPATIPQHHHTGFRLTRKRVLSFLFLIAGIILLLAAFGNLQGDTITALTLANGAPGTVPTIYVPTLVFSIVVGLFWMATGIAGITQPASIERYVTTLLVLAGAILVPAVLIYAAAGRSTNAVTILTESLRLGTPIAIGAMAGIWCERSGVVNIAIEGMMLFSACFGFTAFFLLRNSFPPEQIGWLLLLSVVVSVLSGGIVSLLHGWLSITFATDQIVSGTVINILAIGVTSFIRREVLLSSEAGLTTLPAIKIPILSDIPIIGPALFIQKPIFFLMFGVIILTHIVLFHTRWGLRTRAVGENPHAADTLGIKVNQMRWINVFIGGMIAGLAGAWFTLETTGRFTDNMTDGTGFIALAAMIFGKWTPFGAFGGALLFGLANAIGARFQIIDVPVPPQFLQMVPYLVTLMVLAGLVGRAIPPRAVGKPYKKESTSE